MKISATIPVKSVQRIQVSMKHNWRIHHFYRGKLLQRQRESCPYPIAFTKTIVPKKSPEATPEELYLSVFGRLHFTSQKIDGGRTARQSHVCVISTCLAQTSPSPNVIKGNAFDKPSVLPLAPRDVRSFSLRYRYKRRCRLVAMLPYYHENVSSNFEITAARRKVSCGLDTNFSLEKLTKL